MCHDTVDRAIILSKKGHCADFHCMATHTLRNNWMVPALCQLLVLRATEHRCWSREYMRRRFRSEWCFFLFNRSESLTSKVPQQITELFIVLLINVLWYNICTVCTAKPRVAIILRSTVQIWSYCSTVADFVKILVCLVYVDNEFSISSRGWKKQLC